MQPVCAGWYLDVLVAEVKEMVSVKGGRGGGIEGNRGEQGKLPVGGAMCMSSDVCFAEKGLAS